MLTRLAVLQAVLIEEGEMSIHIDLSLLDAGMLAANGLWAQYYKKNGKGSVFVLLQKGAFVGDIRALTNGGLEVSEQVECGGRTRSSSATSITSLQAFSGVMTKPGQLLVIERKGLNEIFYHYPGIFVSLYDVIFRK